jgi:hypothetical protein
MCGLAKYIGNALHNKPFEWTQCDDGAFPVAVVARAAQGRRDGI